MSGDDRFWIFFGVFVGIIFLCLFGPLAIQTMSNGGKDQISCDSIHKVESKVIKCIADEKRYIINMDDGNEYLVREDLTFSGDGNPFWERIPVGVPIKTYTSKWGTVEEYKVIKSYIEIKDGSCINCCKVTYA